MREKLETAIYIDYDNLYRSIDESYSQFTGSEVVRKIISYFDNSDNCDYKIKLIKAFCDFKNSSQEIEDLQNNLVELRHINSAGNGKSNASDIGLAIDVIKSFFNTKKFENYVIVSSDSDMLPLILELNYQGKEVNLVYLKSKISDKYINMLNQRANIKTVEIEEILGVEVYKPIEKTTLHNDLELVSKYLNLINEIINDIYAKYKEETTIAQRVVLRKLLQKDSSLQKADAIIILDFMKENNYLRQTIKEVDIKGKKEKRDSFLLSKQDIQNANITLKDEPVESWS